MNKVLALLLVLVLFTSGCALVTIWGTDGNISLSVSSMSYARDALNDTTAGAPKDEGKVEEEVLLPIAR